MIRTVLYRSIIVVALGSLGFVSAFASTLILGSSYSDSSRFTFEKLDDSGALLLQGNLSIGRSGHTATVLSNGDIFVAGGWDDSTSWQIMDQNAHVLSSGYLVDQRYLAGATLLPNGNVFIAGGQNTPGTWEIHSPTGALVASGSLFDSRSAGLSVATLNDGNVWISGGASGGGGTYEIRNESGGLVSTGSLNNDRSGANVVVLSNSNVMLIGGNADPTEYEIRTQTGSLVQVGALTDSHDSGAGALTLLNGNVFIYGCSNTCVGAADSTWEIRDVNGKSVASGLLQDARSGAQNSLLSSGNVLITGGDLAPGSWEIRSPSGGFVSSGSLFDTRYSGHTDVHF